MSGSQPALARKSQFQFPGILRAGCLTQPLLKSKSSELITEYILLKTEVISMQNASLCNYFAIICFPVIAVYCVSKVEILYGAGATALLFPTLCSVMLHC